MAAADSTPRKTGARSDRTFPSPLRCESGCPHHATHAVVQAPEGCRCSMRLGADAPLNQRWHYSPAAALECRVLLLKCLAVMLFVRIPGGGWSAAGVLPAVTLVFASMFSSNENQGPMKTALAENGQTNIGRFRSIRGRPAPVLGLPVSRRYRIGACLRRPRHLQGTLVRLPRCYYWGRHHQPRRGACDQTHFRRRLAQLAKTIRLPSPPAPV